MQPVVVLRRDPAVDALAKPAPRDRRHGREHRDSQRRHSGPRKRSRSERDRERGRGRDRDRGRERNRERPHSLQIRTEVADGLDETVPIKRRKKWSSLSHDVDPSYRDRHRAEDAASCASDTLHVMELVKRWRQAEPQATPSGQDTPMPLSSPSLDTTLTQNEVWKEEGLGGLCPSPVPPPPVQSQPPAASTTSPRPAGVHQCEACLADLSDAEEKANHIKLHPYHCQRCHQAFASQNEFMQHLRAVHPNTQQLHHCLLCLKTFSTERQHAEHMKGWSHCHMERAQRRTIHTLFRMFTGSDCPRLNPLTPEETQSLDWLPSDPGVIHFYHQATPLQLATEERPLHRGSMCGQSSSGKDQTLLDL